MAMPLNLQFAPAGSPTGLQNVLAGMQAAFTPQQIQAALAKQMAESQYYQGRGQQELATANLNNTRANLESQGLQGDLGQMYLLSQRPEIAQNPDQSAQFQTGMLNKIAYGGKATPENPAFLGQQIQILKSLDPNSAKLPILQARYDQLLANMDAQTQERMGAAAANQARANIGIPAEANRDNSQAQFYSADSARAIAEGQNQIADAVNKGYPTNYNLTPTIGGANSQTTSYQQSTPKENFQFWSPDQQANYIANNNIAPPLPAGTAITEKVDQKSEARMNGLAPSADAINFIQQGLNNPNIQKYMGKNVPAYIRAGQGQVLSAGGNMPEDYAEYKAFVSNAQSMVADTIATTQTGSRSFGMMQQFQKIFDPSQKLSLQEAQKAVKDAGDILYSEGLSYVGQPYERGLRNAAFNGVKKLQNYGFGNQPNSAQGFGGFSNDQIDSYAKKYNLSRDQVVNMIQSKQGAQ